MDDTLIIYWPYLIIGVCTLWFPRQWLRVGKIARKRRRQRETLEKFADEGGHDPDDKSVKLGRELANPRNYLDLLRALAGSFALWHFSFEATQSDDRTTALLLGTGLSLGGVLIQTVRWSGGRVSFFAPIFYIAGLSIGLGNPYAGVFALLLVCAINPVIPNPRMFLASYGLLLLPFDFMFSESTLRMVISAGLVLVIPLLSLLAGRPVVIFTKKAG